MKQWLQDARADAFTWQGADPSLKAKGLRATAMVILGEEDVTGAERLLEEADGLEPQPDRTARGLLLRAKSGGAAARALPAKSGQSTRTGPDGSAAD
ncbi:hypothetical protein K9B32_07535 [Rhizobium sp. 3T7]|uniref:hypothetical protein n=1 Tax=Rhizobium sp. 3T7 TaxID=2874922 RepID=UPI001CCD4E86|nr:hypothetical protein [Rhizobium sp. 3T7]MBZ9789981.1 hypothetical protein [Rhizobium sp. 3T7]